MSGPAPRLLSGRLDRDQTLALIRDPYRWATDVRAGRPAASTTLIGRPAVIVGGREGVRRFYEPTLSRHRAVPAPVRLVLFGAGAIHGLDDTAHHRRKALFTRVIDQKGAQSLGALAAEQWAERTARWSPGQTVDLFDEAVSVIARSVLPWSGVDLTTAEQDTVGRQMTSVVAGFATPGTAYVRAAWHRERLNRWASQQIRQERAEPTSATGTALQVMAERRGDGYDMPVRVAAVELLNVTRPALAVAWFICHGAAALTAHPQWRRPLADGDAMTTLAVAQEVRRLYPFVPALAARTRHPQDVLGIPAETGALVVLDVHGTNHDAAYWDEPNRFVPNRFLQGEIDSDVLVPQGGGGVTTGHRCPGEDPTLMLLSAALAALSRVPHRAGAPALLTPRHAPAPAPRTILVGA